MGTYQRELGNFPPESAFIRLNTLQSNEGISNMLLLSLIGTYAALVLLVSSFTMLSVQQLTDAIEQKHRFDIIRKLGVERKECQKTARRQMYFWFGLPVLTAIVGSIGVFSYLLWSNYNEIIAYVLPSQIGIILTLSLATMFVGLTMGAGYKANMKAYYPYDAGVAIDAPLEKSSMDSIVSFTEEHCEVEDSVIYYLYAVPEKPIEALSLSDYNHLREILGLSPVVMGKNEFLVHCDTWNYMDGIRQGLKQQPELTFNGWTLTVAETPILTEPMEQYQMAGTKGYVLVLPDEAASQLVGEKIRLALKLKDGGYPELKSDLKQFLNSGKWQPELQSGQQLPEKVTMGVTVKAWGIANSLTGFTAISFCGLYLSIIFIILSCSVLAFEQLSAIDKNQKNYAVIDRLGVPSHRQASLIRRELSTVFLIPLLFPLLLTVLLIAGAQFFFGEAILQQGLVPLYGLVTILLFCAIYLTYFGATMFLFKRVILRPEMR